VCGICGICNPSAGLRGAEELLPQMLAAIRHRGPDAQGSHVAAHAALGAARLAIIDLVGGDQPIFNENRRVTLVFNGEIYNYRELRADLVERGHGFASQTDSEVIVHLYEEHGAKLVESLNGMFAFAIWDEERQTLLLARDRFGIKPLYYTWDGERLAFGSEVKSLLGPGIVRAAVDPAALLELLTFQNILSDQSLFQGVKVLPPGSLLRLSADGLAVERYWRPRPSPDPDLDRDDLAERVAEELERAVERQLVADVEVASYLSGGLDTSAVARTAAMRLRRLTTFSAGFDVAGATGREAEFDERADAALLANELGTHHHELLLDSSDMEMVFPRLILHLEEPRMSFSYPNYLTAGMTSRWVKVVLSGIGGDEIFGGYPWRYGFADGPAFHDRYFDYWNRLFKPAELRKLIDPDFAADVDFGRPRAIYDTIMGEVGDLPALDQILYFESSTYLHGLLVVEDKVSMAHGLESRVPFLDNSLVDLMLRVPAATRVDKGSSKDLLRRAMAGRLPDHVVGRKKTGFTPPQEAWFRSAQFDYVQEILLSPRTLERGVVRPDALRAMVAGHRSGTDHRLALWTLLGLEWWHRVFVDGEHAA